MTPTRYVGIVLASVLALSFFTGAYAWSEAGRFTRAGYAGCAYIEKKLALASAIAKPKLVIVGGSNAAAGIKVGQIADAFQVKGFNFALVATFSPGFQLFEARKILRSGDAVLLSFEYLGYDYQTPTGGQIDAVYSCGTDYWRSLDWTERLFFVFAVRPQRFFDTLRFDAATKERVQAQLAQQIGADGDLLESPVRADDIGTHQPLVIRFREDSNGVKAIEEFVAWAKSNNIAIFATWPNTLYFPQYRSDPALARIAAFYRSLGVVPVGEPQDAMFPPELLSDTVYHLSKAGMEIRTGILTRQLQAAPAFAQWTAQAKR